MDRFNFRKRSRANTDVGKFFVTVEQIRILIQDLETIVDNLKKKQNEILAVPLANDSRTLQLEEMNSKIKSLSNVIRTKLKIIEKSIEEIEGDKRSTLLELEIHTEGGYTPAILRIRKTQFTALAKQYSEILSNYQQAQISYRDQVRARLKRQLEIGNCSEGSVSDEVIEDMIDRGDLTAFRTSITFESPAVAKKNLEDLQARHQDLLKLEKSIRDLNDLFNELAQHVEFQGYVIDNIGENLAKTGEYVRDGKREVEQAKAYHAGYQKKKVWTLVVVGVLLALLLLSLLIYLSIIYI